MHTGFDPSRSSQSGQLSDIEVRRANAAMIVMGAALKACTDTLDTSQEVFHNLRKVDDFITGKAQNVNCKELFHVINEKATLMNRHIAQLEIYINVLQADWNLQKVPVLEKTIKDNIEPWKRALEKFKEGAKVASIRIEEIKEHGNCQLRVLN